MRSSVSLDYSVMKCLNENKVAEDPFHHYVLLASLMFQIMNETEKFEVAVRNVIRTVHFDNNIVVSVFEVIIRVLG